MTLMAHIYGLPVEEVLLPLAYGGGAALWVAVRRSLLPGRRARTNSGPEQRSPS